MRLRTHLALSTLVAALPLVAGLAVLDAVARRRAAEAELANLALARLETPGERGRCEADPASWGSVRAPSEPPSGPPPGPPPPEPGRPPEGRDGGSGGARGHRRPAAFWALDEQLRASLPAAPLPSPRLAVGLEPGAFHSAGASWVRGDIAVLLRTPWGLGRCAFVFARGTSEPWLGAIIPPLSVWLFPGLVLIVGVLLAVGPTLSRLGRLTAAVERSSASAYRLGVPVEGSDEIAALAASFDAAAREARSLLDERDRRERALREFLANTTHDVMIPLTVLQGHLAEAQAEVAAGRPLSRALLKEALGEAHYLGGLLHDLATMARLESAEPRLAAGPVELGALVARVMGRHRPIARQLEVEIECATPALPVVAQADLTLLEQLVSNLVYNAICHNRPGGHAALILDGEEGARFRIRVIDDGVGISEDQLARLAERGFRGNEARTRSPHGQGLGLDIAYRVARLHGFPLVLRRSEYGGLEAELSGPLARA